MKENEISDLDVLDEVNFPNLKVLDLTANNIKNINIFEYANFPNLKY